MGIAEHLEDLTNVTKDEMEKRCIPAPLDSEEHVQLTEDYWTEVDGIRYLKKPIMVDFAAWGKYTMDCSSLVSRLFGPYTLCVIAFSASEEATAQLGNAFSDETLWEKGYSFFFGFSSKELHSID